MVKKYAGGLAYLWERKIMTVLRGLALRSWVEEIAINSNKVREGRG